MNYSIIENQRFNSLEISFEGKPDEETRTALKSLGFRWNPKKSIWYGFAEVEAVKNAISGISLPVEKKPSALPSIWERTRTSNIPEHELYQDVKEIARQTREHFKKVFPEVKISCRIGKGGWASCHKKKWRSF